MSIRLELLRQEIADKLCQLERVLPEEYRLTLVARHSANDEAHIVVTIEKNMADVLAAIYKLHPESQRDRQCYLQEEDPPEEHDIERFSCVCGKCYEALANLHDAAQSALTAAQARIEELERMRIIDNNAKCICTCWSKAPTVPTFRDQNKHLNDCPMRDSGLPVGVNADMGSGASLVCIPRDEYDALQVERAALAERIRGIKCDEPEVDSFSRCYANGFRDALEAAAQLAEPKGGGE